MSDIEVGASVRSVCETVIPACGDHPEFYQHAGVEGTVTTIDTPNDRKYPVIVLLTSGPDAGKTWAFAFEELEANHGG
jgi:hypothetical protein